jgi:hypothetical protein
VKQDLTISEALLAVRAAVRFQCGEANARPLMDEVNTILVNFGDLPPLTAAEEMIVAERRLTRALAIIADLREKAEYAAEEARDMALARAEAREEAERDGMDWDGQ